MKILFSVQHPADFQVVKFIAQELARKGNQILFTVIERENIIERMVITYGFSSEIIGEIKLS